MKPIWKTYLQYAGMAIGAVLLSIIIEAVRAKNTGFETKTLWDWMELLIIPFVLALAAFYLNRSKREIERQTAEARSKLEREIAIDRQQESALQAYLDRMTELLLKEKLRTTKKSRGARCCKNKDNRCYVSVGHKAEQFRYPISPRSKTKY